MRKIIILGLVLGLILIISCTKDSNTFGQNDYRAFSVCLEENPMQNSQNHDSLIIGTVPNGKQWVVVSVSQNLFLTISQYQNQAIVIGYTDDGLIGNLPFYIDEGNEVILHGHHTKEILNSVYGYSDYGDCISINEYNVD